MGNCTRKLVFMLLTCCILLSLSSCRLFEIYNPEFYHDYTKVRNEVVGIDNKIKGLCLAGTEDRVPTKIEVQTIHKKTSSLRTKAQKLETRSEREKKAKQLLLKCINQLIQATKVLGKYSQTGNQDDYYQVEEDLDKSNRFLYEADRLVYNLPKKD